MRRRSFLLGGTAMVGGVLLDQDTAGAASGPAAPASTQQPSFGLPLASRDQSRIVVLSYHGVQMTNTVEAAVLPARFDNQLDWLNKHPVEVIAMSELCGFLEGQHQLPRYCAVITFDDGLRNNFTHAFPALQKHNCKFTLALNTKVIEDKHPKCVTWEQVREMLASGLCQVASHGHVHANLNKVGEASLRQEIELSRDLIQQHAGVRAEVYVYPFGAYSNRVAARLQKAGYRAAFTVDWRPPVDASTNRYALPRRGVFRSHGLAYFKYLFPRGAHQPLAQAAP